MNNSIFELAKSYLGENFARDAASKLNESQEGISRAVEAIVPTIFAGIGHRAAGDESFMKTVFSLAKNIFTNGSLNNLTNVFGSNQSASATQAGTFVNNLLGNHYHGVVEKISHYASIAPSSARDLFEASAVASLGSVGRDAVERGSTVDSITHFFTKNRNSFLEALPATLGIGTLLFGTPASGMEDDLVAADPEVAPPVVQQYERQLPEDKKNSNKFLLPLLMALVGIALLLFLMKQCNKTTVADNPYDSSTTQMDSMQPLNNDTAIMPLREPLVVALPSGASINAYRGGMEEQVVTFLRSDDYANANSDQLKDKWFDFDNINFEFNTAKLTPESKPQLDNLVAILKEFPEAKVKVGGYSDKKGDDKANLTLSQERADAIYQALAAAGTQVVGAEGYGEQFATVPETASDAERAVDRRMAIRFEK